MQTPFKHCYGMHYFIAAVHAILRLRPSQQDTLVSQQDLAWRVCNRRGIAPSECVSNPQSWLLKGPHVRSTSASSKYFRSQSLDRVENTHMAGAGNLIQRICEGASPTGALGQMTAQERSRNWQYAVNDTAT